MKKNKLSELSQKDIEEITLKASRRKNIPLIKSEQVNMRIDPLYLSRIKELAKQCGEKHTTFILNLIIEDIDRLWSVYKRENK